MVEIYNMIAEVEAVQRKQHNVDKMFKERRMRVREGCGKSKWKFKMAFAMKGRGGLEGVSSATYLF